MKKNGSALEIIIAQLERLLSEDSIKITRDDKIYDHVAETNRQVDISIRGKFGSSDVLIIIECRDRNKKQGPSWIEEIHTKTKDLNANGVIAVSTSGFTKSAYKKAKRHNIELRTLTEIDPNEVKEWIDQINFTFSNYQFHVTLMELGHVDHNVVDQINPEKLKSPNEIAKFIFNPRDPIFIIPKSAEKISISNIVRNVITQTDYALYKNIVPNTKPFIRKFNLYLYHPSQTIFVDINNKKRRVIFIFITAEFSIKQQRIPVSKALRYQSKDRVIGEKLDYSWKIKEDTELTLSVQRDSEKQKQNILVITKTE